MLISSFSFFSPFLPLSTLPISSILHTYVLFLCLWVFLIAPLGTKGNWLLCVSIPWKQLFPQDILYIMDLPHFPHDPSDFPAKTWQSVWSIYSYDEYGSLEHPKSTWNSPPLYILEPPGAQ